MICATATLLCHASEQEEPRRQAHCALGLEPEGPWQDGPAPVPHVLPVLRGERRAVVPDVPAQRRHGLGGAVQHRILRPAHAAGCSGAAEAASGRAMFVLMVGEGDVVMVVVMGLDVGARAKHTTQKNMSRDAAHVFSCDTLCPYKTHKNKRMSELLRMFFFRCLKSAGEPIVCFLGSRTAGVCVRSALRSCSPPGTNALASVRKPACRSLEVKPFTHWTDHRSPLNHLNLSR